MGDLDVMAKILMSTAPEAFVGLGLGRAAEVREVRAVDKEFQAREVRLDKLYELVLQGEAEPRWLHVEVAAVWESNLPARMFDYWVLARQAVGGPIDSLLVCLKPGEKQGAPRSSFHAAGLARLRGVEVRAPARAQHAGAARGCGGPAGPGADTRGVDRGAGGRAGRRRVAGFHAGGDRRLGGGGGRTRGAVAVEAGRGWLSCGDSAGDAPPGWR